MWVVHGVWAREALCLWAEDPDLPPSRPVVASGLALHPFACQAAELADVLAALPALAGEAARKAVDGELTLQLPSAAGPLRPLASPGVTRPDLPRPGRIRLVSWRVPVLALPPAAALDLLRGDLSELVIPGASLPYLAAVARLADGLAARGRVLPVLVCEGPVYAARWRPVLDGADAQRARDLAGAMPPSCRAVAAEPPGALLAAALDGLADAAARTRLPGSLLPARRGRTPVRLSLAERYVAALTSTDARLSRRRRGRRARRPAGHQAARRRPPGTRRAWPRPGPAHAARRRCRVPGASGRRGPRPRRPGPAAPGRVRPGRRRTGPARPGRAARHPGSPARRGRRPLRAGPGRRRGRRPAPAPASWPAGPGRDGAPGHPAGSGRARRAAGQGRRPRAAAA